MNDKTITNGLQYFLYNEDCNVAMLGRHEGNEIYPARTYLRIFFQNTGYKGDSRNYEVLPSEIVVEDDLFVYENLMKELRAMHTNTKINLLGKNINVLYDGMIFILCKGDE